MAFSLYFFLQDVCGRDFYAYVSQHFGQGQLSPGVTTDLLHGFIRKVTAIANVGPKLAHMAMSGLFLTRYPGWDYRPPSHCGPIVEGIIFPLVLIINNAQIHHVNSRRRPRTLPKVSRLPGVRR
jgi:hypothetical protein